MPAEEFPDALFGQLTADIQAGNESAFLGLASAAARPAIKAWWDNLAAIGFTTGAVVPTAGFDAVHIDRHGDGTAVVLAGAHSPLDPHSDFNKPEIPMGRYQIGLHFTSPGATGQITSWKPLDNAPWDLGSPLYVRKAQYVTVAGPPGDRALVDQTLPIAEAAAAYEVTMMSHYASLFLQQQGFVVFVSGSTPVANGWLAAATQPPGWPPAYRGARTVQLPGPAVSADAPLRNGTSGLVANVADNLMGGARVVLAPASGETAADETATLVHEFTLDVQSAQNEFPVSGVAAHPVPPSWTEEGFADVIQSAFQANPDPVVDEHNWAPFTAALHALPASYRNGTYPSSQQLFSPSAARDEAWGDVAASTYRYIDTQYGFTDMLIAGMEVYAETPSPFGNIIKSGKTVQTLKFFGIHSIRLGWQPWLARL